ncbi:MAG: TonB-dependent receptor [Bacteroidota bacterium]
MKKANQPLLLAVALFSTFLCNAQQVTINGSVIDSTTGQPMQSVSVLLKGSNSGAITNAEGKFHINGKIQLPATLIFSFAEHNDVEHIVTNPDDEVTISMTPDYKSYNVLVVGDRYFRTPLIKTSVSIERYGAQKIVNSPSTSYYDAAGVLKAVDITTSGLLFKTISTRGFNGSGSTRVNQFVDGMDNQAPGLNFFVGNFVGLTELDVDNVELLPGASSALYGAGGMNGTVLINSKNPFKYQGLSVQVKQGVMHLGESMRGKASPFSDYSIRFAKAINKNLAFKIGAQYIFAKDWLAGDTSNYSGNGNTGSVIGGTRQTDPNYNGVNVYGDETSVDLRKFLPPGVVPGNNPIMVSRTGYNEKDVIDPDTKNIKLSGALHYKINSKLEAQIAGYWATGNTVYTGNNRYALKDIKIGQYKFELKHRDWFFRTYTTQENAGQAYTATVAMQVLNEVWKPSFDPNNVNGSWYPQYTGAFLNSFLTDGDIAKAHTVARGFADQDRPQAGSAQFNQIFGQVRKTPLPNGAMFLEKSQLWMSEGQYNFSDKIKFIDIVAGANFKKYILDSKGTLFIDTAGPIRINEMGAYVQATKRLFQNVLTLSASGRYDKNEDFKGHFTPRFTALVKVAKNNYLRMSYQTAYRFPSTQQKFIRLNVGDYTLLGGLPWVMDYMQAKSGNVHELINGIPSANPYVYKEFKPESSSSFEMGYKGVIAEKLLIDAYGYLGQYKDFLGRNVLVNLSNGQVFSTVVNSTTKVKTHGFGLGLDYSLQKNFNLFLNAYSDVITDVPTGFQAFFNTPKYRLNAGFGNTGLGKSNRTGFNVTLHWQDAFMWDGELANGAVNAFTTMDAQVNYKFPKIKSMVKLGATNLFNHYYKNAYANPEVGGLYYVSLAYNVL